MLWPVASVLLNRDMTGSTQPPESISVIGAGIIGLACALELAERGIMVSLYDSQWPPRGASWAAAGMLAPAFEAAATPETHPDLYTLCLASARLWPIWAQRLEHGSDMPSGFRPGPSLAVARNSAQAAHLDAIFEQLEGDDAAQRVSTSELARIEPAIRSELISAVLLPSDGQVDNRLTMAALIARACGHPNLKVIAAPAPLICHKGDLDHAGRAATLITAGWKSAQVEIEVAGEQRRLGECAPVLDQIEAFGGQMLSLAPIPQGPSRPIRCGDLYIVPKHDRIIVGATTEPGRVLAAAEPKMIQRLHARAVEICPALAGATIVDQWAGVRPGTADHAPILGQVEDRNLFIATGHYRNGILLAPITAQIMADLIVDGKMPDLARSFSPKARAETRV